MKKFLLLLIFVLLFSASETCFAQSTTAEQRNPRLRGGGEDEDFARDLLKKQRIKAEEKAFQNILERCDESDKIVSEVKNSFSQNRRLTTEDLAKLERVGKNSRKILNWMNAESSDEQSLYQPKDTAEGLDKIYSISHGLREKLTKSTRFSISVSVIEEISNVLKISEMLRLGTLK